MDSVYPDLDWYEGKSKAAKVTLRCPYANVHRCPRYYHSLCLLGDANISTKIESNKKMQLDQFWSTSDLIPVVAEHDTAISGADGKHSCFSNFCPEISYDIFGLFASNLSRYADETDEEVAHSRLTGEGAGSKDWRWVWSIVSPLHYLECKFYAQLIVHPVNSAPTREKAELPIMEDKLSIFGLTFHPKALLTRLANWWLSKQRQ